MIVRMIVYRDCSLPPTRSYSMEMHKSEYHTIYDLPPHIPVQTLDYRKESS
jgi:hypothetical protein